MSQFLIDSPHVKTSRYVNSNSNMTVKKIVVKIIEHIEEDTLLMQRSDNKSLILFLDPDKKLPGGEQVRWQADQQQTSTTCPGS